MKSNSFVTVRIYGNQSKWNYQGNKIFFSEFPTLFLKSTSDFEHPETKDDPHSLRIFEISDYERRG